MPLPSPAKKTSQKQERPERTRGVKPGDPEERTRRVTAAIRELQRIGAAFTVADIAERAGVSRATIYRTPALRDLVGAKGDCARPVASDIHARLTKRHEALKTKARDLRGELADLERSWTEMRERALAAERRLEEAERHIASLKSHLNGHGSGNGTLAGAAARLDANTLRRARRQIAAVLHPDLFSQDPAAAALASELLKSLNALTG